MLNKERLEQATKLANRKYSVVMSHDYLSDGTIMFMAKNPELPGCKAQGVSQMDAVKNLHDARIDYIYFLLEDALEVPDPNPQIIVTDSQVITHPKSKLSSSINGDDLWIEKQIVKIG